MSRGPLKQSTATSSAASTTYSYVPVDDAGDEHVWARVVEDCPRCPCHAARVCANGLWHQASRPTHAEGTPYSAPCPCEETAKVPEPRRLTIAFKGAIRTLEAEYHRHGVMRGRLRVLGWPFHAEPDDAHRHGVMRGRLRVLGWPFHAEPDDGSAPGRCGMVLARSKVMRTARDDHGETWLVTARASVGGRPAIITGWWSDAGPVA